MISAKNIYSVAKKDLRLFFETPTGYIILIVFLLMWEFLFFRNVFLVGMSSLQGMFEILPTLSIFVIPALTMGSISQEYQEGTIEFLLTHPLRQLELILGKFFAVLFLFALTLLFSLPIALSLSAFGSLDWGVYLSQLLAAFFMGSVFIALGILISSILNSQISALILAVISSFFLYILGAEIVTRGLPSFLANIFGNLSVSGHYSSMARGVIDLRDVWYFLSAVVLLLTLSYLMLLRKRISRNKKPYRRLKAWVSLVVLIIVITNVFGNLVQARLDMTSEKTFTLSAGTVKELKGLQEPVAVTVFVSAELPVQFQPVLKETKNILNDYRAIGGSKVEISYKDPSSDDSLAQEAMANGIQRVQFNVVEKEALSLKNGFFGIAVSKGDQRRSIPFVQSTSDLEFQLTSMIHELTATEKTKIAFLSGYGVRTDYSAFTKELERQFSVELIKLEGKKPEVPAEIKALIIADPSEKMEEPARLAISKYLEQGGSVLLLVETERVDQSLAATANENNFADFAGQFGVTVKNDLVYDLRSNETIRFATDQIQYLLPYPFFTRVGSVPGHQITAKIKGAVLPWASSLSPDKEKIASLGYADAVLLKTSPYAGSAQEPFVLTPEQPLPQSGLEEKVMGISLEKPAAEDPSKLSRLIVIGDSDFIADPFAFFTENQVFGVNCLSWLTQEESLASIKLKSLNDRKLVFKNETQMSLVRYGNISLALILPLAFGLYNYLRRKSLRRAAFKA